MNKKYTSRTVYRFVKLILKHIRRKKIDTKSGKLETLTFSSVHTLPNEIL